MAAQMTLRVFVDVTVADDRLPYLQAVIGAQPDVQIVSLRPVVAAGFDDVPFHLFGRISGATEVHR